MPGHTGAHGGNKQDKVNKGKKNGNKPTGAGGMTPGPGPGGQMVAGATPDPIGGVAIGGTTEGFAGQATPGGGGGQSLQDLFAAQTPVSTAPVAAAPEYVEEEEEKKTTNSIIEALFNKNLTFEYDPVADYVNRVYGGLRPDQKKKMLARLGYDVEDMTMSEALSQFGDFLDISGQALYDAGNLQFSDLANIFKPKPQPEVQTTPLSGQQIAGQVIGTGLEAIALPKTLPYTNPFFAFMTPGATPLGMFTSLAFREGDFQLDEDGNIVGDIANLQNAPQNYLDAVASYNAAAAIDDPSLAATLDQTGLGFTPEQAAQIAMGGQQRAAEQAATRGPAEIYTTDTDTDSGTGQEGSDPIGIDYQAIYDEFSADQKATADKIEAMDGYDFAYAVNYVRLGGPLF